MDISRKDYFMNWHRSTKNRRYHFDYVYDPALRMSKVDLYQTGELIVANGYEISEHVQICDEISYVVDGSCSFYTDGKVYHAKKGDIHIAPERTHHRIVVGNNETLRMAYLGFCFREKDQRISELQHFYSTIPQQLRNDEHLCSRTFEILLNEVYAAQDFAIDVIDACVSEILIYVYRIYQCGSGDKVSRIVEEARLEKTVGNTVVKVIRYVDENIESVLSVDQIADELKYSRSYLSRIFSEKMNMSLHQYIDQRKVAAAKRLMEEGLSVSETAVRLGYLYPQSLWKLFWRCEGCPPSDFLKKRESL